MYLRLTGSADRIQQVIRHFSLRVDEERSSTDLDVEVDDEDEEEEVEMFAESVGVKWEEI